MTILSSDYPRISLDILESSFYWRKHSGSIRWNLELQDFVVGAVFGEVGGWLDWLRALEMTFHMWRRPLMTLILCGRCSIWWGWRVIFAAGAVFGEVGGWLFVAGAALRDILGDSWDAKCCILQYKIVSKLGRVRSPKRRVRDDDFILGLSSDIVGYPRIMVESSFYWRKHFRDFRANLDLQDFVAGAVFGEVGGWLDWLRAVEMTFQRSTGAVRCSTL